MSHFVQEEGEFGVSQKHHDDMAELLDEDRSNTSAVLETFEVSSNSTTTCSDAGTVVDDSTSSDTVKLLMDDAVDHVGITMPLPIPRPNNIFFNTNDVYVIHDDDADVAHHVGKDHAHSDGGVKADDDDEANSELADDLKMETDVEAEMSNVIEAQCVPIFLETPVVEEQQEQESHHHGNHKQIDEAMTSKIVTTTISLASPKPMNNIRPKRLSEDFDAVDEEEQEKLVDTVDRNSMEHEDDNDEQIMLNQQGQESFGYKSFSNSAFQNASADTNDEVVENTSPKSPTFINICNHNNDKYIVSTANEAMSFRLREMNINQTYNAIYNKQNINKNHLKETNEIINEPDTVMLPSTSVKFTSSSSSTSSSSAGACAKPTNFVSIEDIESIDLLERADFETEQLLTGGFVLKSSSLVNKDVLNLSFIKNSLIASTQQLQQNQQQLSKNEQESKLTRAVSSDTKCTYKDLQTTPTSSRNCHNNSIQKHRLTKSTIKMNLSSYLSQPTAVNNNKSAGEDKPNGPEKAPTNDKHVANVNEANNDEPLEKPATSTAAFATSSICKNCDKQQNIPANGDCSRTMVYKVMPTQSDDTGVQQPSSSSSSTAASGSSTSSGSSSSMFTLSSSNCHNLVSANSSNDSNLSTEDDKSKILPITTSIAGTTTKTSSTSSTSAADVYKAMLAEMQRDLQEQAANQAVAAIDQMVDFNAVDIGDTWPHGSIAGVIGNHDDDSSSISEVEEICTCDRNSNNSRSVISSHGGSNLSLNGVVAIVDDYDVNKITNINRSGLITNQNQNISLNNNKNNNVSNNNNDNNNSNQKNNNNNDDNDNDDIINSNIGKIQVATGRLFGHHNNGNTYSNDLSNYISMVCITEECQQKQQPSTSNGQQRKRKYAESRLLDDMNASSSSNIKIIAMEPDGGHVGAPSNGGKRIAYDVSSTMQPENTMASTTTSTGTTTKTGNFNRQLLGIRTPRSLIPTRDNPPPELNGWLMQFQKWTHVERLVAVDRLIAHCEPTQVRHMMKIIEPQFQRDFISLLPRELALQVLSYLEPKDLLRAAQTCRSWRFLCDDNLLWKEKCRQTQILTESSDKPKRGRAGNMPPIASPWKAAYMRQHIIELNWRSRPIRQPKVLKGHDDHVITCLQFHGNRIVSGSDDNTLKVWSAVTGRCLRTLIGHTGGVWSSQMSGNIIVSGSTDRTLKVWDMETGQCIHTLTGHTSTVRCMHLNGHRVVSGSRDATLRVWDIKRGLCLHVLMGHLAAVRCVQYDGKLIVSGAYDYMVKIWHPERHECLHTLQGHTNRVYSLQFDGVHVVSGSLDTSIRVWDAETGNCKHTLMGHQSLTSGMELRQNILVSGNADSTVKVWDITTGQCLQTLSGPNKHQSAVTCLQFNSRFVVTSSDDGTVKLWDVNTGEFIRNLVALESGGSGGVVWRIRANDTKLICAVGSRNGTEETKLMVLDFDVEGACVKCS